MEIRGPGTAAYALGNKLGVPKCGGCLGRARKVDALAAAARRALAGVLGPRPSPHLAGKSGDPGMWELGEPESVLTEGGIPPGLRFSAGLLAGIPQETGMFSLTVECRGQRRRITMVIE